MARRSFPLVSLFSGAGGLDFGFERAGFRVVFAVDSNSAACQTYLSNFEGEGLVVRGDLSKLPGAAIANIVNQVVPSKAPLGVIGGPPCQAFSQANVFKRGTDARAKLLNKYAEILHALEQQFRLEFFVFENVEGILTSRHQRRFRLFVTRLRKIGFHVFQTTLDAADFGVPQHRRRVFLIGFNRRYHSNGSFEVPVARRSRKTVRDAIRGLGRPTMYARGLEQAQFPRHPNHWCMAPRSAKYWKNGRHHSVRSRSFRRLSWNSPSPTVAYGHNEVHVHPGGKRRVSVLEAMLLQGFRKSFRLRGHLSAQLRLISNAVPPPLAEAIATRIRERLKDKL